MEFADTSKYMYLHVASTHFCSEESRSKTVSASCACSLNHVQKPCLHLVHAASAACHASYIYKASSEKSLSVVSLSSAGISGAHWRGTASLTFSGSTAWNFSKHELGLNSTSSLWVLFHSRRLMPLQGSHTSSASHCISDSLDPITCNRWPLASWLRLTKIFLVRCSSKEMERRFSLFQLNMITKLPLMARNSRNTTSPIKLTLTLRQTVPLGAILIMISLPLRLCSITRNFKELCRNVGDSNSYILVYVHFSIPPPMSDINIWGATKLCSNM